MRHQSVSPIPETGACLDEAIRRSVARAIETGELLDVASESARLAASLPGTARACVADLLIRAGVEARINLALGPESGTEASNCRRAPGDWAEPPRILWYAVGIGSDSRSSPAASQSTNP